MTQERVLIVDDQPNWLSLFSDLLEDEYDVTSMGSYNEAVKVLERDPPFRVAVVDIRLDDKDRLNEDGLRLLEHLKGVTSIVVTGYPTVRTQKKAWNLGAFDYIEKYPEDGKGFNAENFRQVVRNAVNTFAFVVMPFADEYTDIYRNVIKEAVEAKGLACRRADGFHDPSWIMDDVRRCISQSEFLIADLSGRNLNVFYEVGMAHAIGQTVVLLAQTIKDVPPKLRGVRCIKYENSLQGAKGLGKELAQTLDELQRTAFRSHTVFPQDAYTVDPNLCLALVPSANSIAQEAFETIAKTVTEDKGLSCENVQSIYSTQQIMEAIWGRLNQARVVIADLSGGDPEVFYLTGVGHGLGKDVILLAQNEQDIPFNLRGPSCIIYATQPLGRGLEAKKKFERALELVLRKPTTRGTPRSSKSSETRQPRSGQATIVEQYADFSLHIGPGGHARAVSDEGQRQATISPTIPTDVTLTINLIEQGQTNADLLKQFGGRLYQIIFPADIDKHFNQTEAVARTQNHKVRIRLTIEPDALAQLPWEFLYREEGGYFLATNPNTVLSHYLDLPLPPGYVRQREGPLHMLVIISNPNDQPVELDAAKWERIVRKALSEPIRQGLLTLQVVKQATFEKMQDALLAQPPDIVQFVGHGVYQNGKGYLALVNESGGTWVVDDEQFASIFTGVQDRLGLVCLATCESAKSDSPKSFLGIAPQLVRRGTPAVVAMRYPVRISTAEIFMDSFYKSVAARKPMDWAVQWARNAISIQVGLDNREFATPVLFMRAKDGSIF